MKHKLIGLYQLITGIFGFILIAANITKVFKSIDVFFTFIIGLLLFAGIAYSGYALLNSLRNAVKYSVWAQALQIISFTTTGIQYLFSGSGFFYLQLTHSIALKAQIEPIAYNISGVSDLLPFELRVYFIPLVLVILLVTGKK
jgi:hypothetical protein